jgi:hypothetical protein
LVVVLENFVRDVVMIVEATESKKKHETTKIQAVATMKCIGLRPE